MKKQLVDMLESCVEAARNKLDRDQYCDLMCEINSIRSTSRLGGDNVFSGNGFSSYQGNIFKSGDKLFEALRFTITCEDQSISIYTDCDLKYYLQPVYLDNDETIEGFCVASYAFPTLRIREQGVNRIRSILKKALKQGADSLYVSLNYRGDAKPDPFFELDSTKYNECVDRFAC